MKPITYPARPINGGHLDRALPKVGEWSYEPKYNGWRAIIHVPSGTMWNRHGKLLSIAREFETALAILKRTGIEWLDVEALERRHALGRGSLIVLDWPTGGGVYDTYKSRTEALFRMYRRIRSRRNPPSSPEANRQYRLYTALLWGR
jgi:hypothetical protein